MAFSWDEEANRHNLLGLPPQIKRPFLMLCFRALSKAHGVEPTAAEIKAELQKGLDDLAAKHVALGELPVGTYAAIEGDGLQSVQFRHPDLKVVKQWYANMEKGEAE